VCDPKAGPSHLLAVDHGSEDYAYSNTAENGKPLNNPSNSVDTETLILFTVLTSSLTSFSQTQQLDRTGGESDFSW
jgi:hypothetical protein